jgi:integrase
MHGSIRKDKPRGCWVVDVRFGGHRRQLSAPTQKEAKALYSKEIARLLSRGITDASRSFALGEARQLTIQTRWKGMASERTASGYAQDVVDFFGPDFELSEIRAPGVERFRQAMAAKGNQPATINKKVSALKAMLDQALLHGRIEQKPALPQQLKVKNTKDRVLSDKETKGFCDFFRAIGQPEAADLFVFLLESCCRWSEAAKLKGDDVDLEGGRVTFSRTKADRPRTVPLTKRAKDALAGHIPAVPSHSVWSYPYRRYKDLFDQAKSYLGLADDDQLGIHTTRHTCASKLARKGVSLAQIMAFGGWTSLPSVQRYLHVNTQALSECIDALES